MFLSGVAAVASLVSIQGCGGGVLIVLSRGVAFASGFVLPCVQRSLPEIIPDEVRRLHFDMCLLSCVCRAHMFISGWSTAPWFSFLVLCRSHLCAFLFHGCDGRFRMCLSMGSRRSSLSCSFLGCGDVILIVPLAAAAAAFLRSRSVVRRSQFVYGLQRCYGRTFAFLSGCVAVALLHVFPWARRPHAHLVFPGVGGRIFFFFTRGAHIWIVSPRGVGVACWRFFAGRGHGAMCFFLARGGRISVVYSTQRGSHLGMSF